MTTSQAGLLVFFLLLLSCKAFVDNYKWFYPGAEDAMNEISGERDTYSDKRTALLKCYTGDKALACQEQATKQDSTFVILQTKMITIRQKLKSIDTQISNDVQECKDDDPCIQAAKDKGSACVNNYKSQAITDIKKIIKSGLQNIKKLMDNCMA